MVRQIVEVEPLLAQKGLAADSTKIKVFHNSTLARIVQTEFRTAMSTTRHLNGIFWSGVDAEPYVLLKVQFIVECLFTFEWTHEKGRWSR